MKKAISIVGQEAIAELKSKWDTMNTKYGGEEWQQEEGIVLDMMHQDLSDNVIRAIFPVGGSRIARLRKVLRERIDTCTLVSRRRSQRTLSLRMIWLHSLACATTGTLRMDFHVHIDDRANI